MQDFEKLGLFYLGKEYDYQEGNILDNLLMYDSRDLTTHAVCVGMTGSGKTGLCIGLLEEAAIDGIPAIIVDPKGDLSNLLLTFDNLSAEEFLPWVNEAEAEKKGISVADFAQQQAELWKNGLAKWGQDSKRITRLKEAVDFAVYTPGSSAGLPVSILSSFDAPEDAIINDPDLLREKINTTVTSLLNLLDIDADPVQSREHILLSVILDTFWKQKQGLDLAGFIMAIQTPPVSRIGVFSLDSFFPEKDRFALAMKINNLMAAPGFSSWLEGEPLKIDNLLYTGSGKPKLSIFSIAHLNDSERMFFVSLLLAQILGWTRSQSGTSSLRALFYMDEIFGYLPPVANPPSKAPLLTLLKQARAFGLGIVLATQNPVDLDYKALSNTGTWFIGRLQTEQDKKRVLDGLEGADTSAGGKFNRKEIENILSGLDKRVFLMNNVHDDEPVVFHTRWVLSYLRGPLTRHQIKQLMKDRNNIALSKQTGKPNYPSQSVLQTKTRRKVKPKQTRPAFPPDISQYYLPIPSSPCKSGTYIYKPMLLGIGTMYYANARIGIATEHTKTYITDFPLRRSGNVWNNARTLDICEDDLEQFPDEDIPYTDDFPSSAGKPENYRIWEKSFVDWLYHNETLPLLKSSSLKMVSQPGESERDFRIRLQLQAHEKRDQLIEKLRTKYAPKIDRLEDRIRRAIQQVEREKEQAKQQKLQTAISFGAAIFSAFLGRKKVNRSALGRASTTARGAGRIWKESQDIDRAKENVEALQEQLETLQQRMKEEIEFIQASIAPQTEELAQVLIKPKKKDISISLVSLVWVPFCITRTQQEYSR